MNRYRADDLREAILHLGAFARDLPAIGDAITDGRHQDHVKVSGGNRSDPTASTALAASDAWRQIDRAVREIRDRARFLENQRLVLTGQVPSVELTDARGRPTLDDDGNPVDPCVLHHAALSELYPQADIPPARRNIPLSDQRKARVCRWCGDFYDQTGQAPVTSEIIDHHEGRRVRRKELTA